MTAQHSVAQAKRRHERIEVGGKGVVIVASGWLIGLTEAAAVVGDDAIAKARDDEEKQAEVVGNVPKTNVYETARTW